MIHQALDKESKMGGGLTSEPEMAFALQKGRLANC